LGELDIAPKTGETRRLPFVGDTSWFTYRQIVQAGPGRHAVTIVNWPMNDYFLKPVIDEEPTIAAARLLDAKELGRCLLYWMQVELGLTGLYLRSDITGSADGFAMTPYIRESRRIEAITQIKEQDVSTTANPGLKKARSLGPSVGIGAYRIDLHPTTGGDSYLDIGSLPFEIPIGALIPRTRRNLLAACKNIGTTHITNGCYRLHPVEWNIGESAGYLAAYCLDEGLDPQEVAANPNDFQRALAGAGIELAWPDEVYPL
jgi:hypothetical protein